MLQTAIVALFAVAARPSLQERNLAPRNKLRIHSQAVIVGFGIERVCFSDWETRLSRPS